MADMDWSTANIDGVVSIGTHSLYLRAAGPPRSLGTPAVILIAGLGDTCISSSAVVRQISAFARVYTYDRAGLGKSELPADFSLESKSYTNIARELRRLLDTAGIDPPFLLVMHSLGGLPGREFLHLYPEHVAGMVLVDTVTEDNYKTRPTELPLVMRNTFMDVDRSFLWKGQHKPNMTPEELQQVLEDEGLVDSAVAPEDQTRREIAATAEFRNLIPSSDSLAEKCQFEKTVLGDRPVSVIKADLPGEWRKSFEAATMAGKGTTAEKKLVGDYLATADATGLMLQFKQLRLSRNSRMVEARHSWHNVYWYQPELVAREVRWCLEEFGKLMAP